MSIFILFLSTWVDSSKPVLLGRSTTPCGFEGDNDSYGLGVRLGAYLQWLTSIFAYHLSAKEAESMHAVNTCFQIAMTGALIVTTKSQGSEMHAVEAFVILLFCVGGMCPAVTWPWQPNRKLRHPFGRLGPANSGTLVRLLTLLVASSYGVWYTFHGMDVMQHDRCTSNVFWFAQVDLYGRFRSFLKCLFVGTAATVTVIAVDAVVMLLFDLRDFLKNWMEADEDEDNTEEKERARPSWTLVLPSVLTLSILAVMVELTLHWSHVRNVNSCNTTGQLFPLIVGAAGALRLTYVFLLDFLRGNLSF